MTERAHPTYELLRRHRPSSLSGTRVLARTEAVAAPPFVARADLASGDLARLRGALRAALEDPLAADAREAMLLEGVEALELDAYQRIADLDALARDLAYGDLDGVARSGASPTRAQTSP